MNTAETDRQPKIYYYKYVMKSSNIFDAGVNIGDEEKLIDLNVLKETSIVINTIFYVRNIAQLVMNPFIPPYLLEILQENRLN